MNMESIQNAILHLQDVLAKPGSDEDPNLPDWEFLVGLVVYFETTFPNQNSVDSVRKILEIAARIKKRSHVIKEIKEVADSIQGKKLFDIDEFHSLLKLIDSL